MNFFHLKIPKDRYDSVVAFSHRHLSIKRLQKFLRFSVCKLKEDFFIGRQKAEVEKDTDEIPPQQFLRFLKSVFPSALTTSHLITRITTSRLTNTMTPKGELCPVTASAAKARNLLAGQP